MARSIVKACEQVATGKGDGDCGGGKANGEDANGDAIELGDETDDIRCMSIEMVETLREKGLRRSALGSQF